MPSQAPATRRRPSPNGRSMRFGNVDQRGAGVIDQSGSQIGVGSNNINYGKPARPNPPQDRPSAQDRRQARPLPRVESADEKAVRINSQVSTLPEHQQEHFRRNMESGSPPEGALALASAETYHPDVTRDERDDLRNRRFPEEDIPLYNRVRGEGGTHQDGVEWSEASHLPDAARECYIYHRKDEENDIGHPEAMRRAAQVRALEPEQQAAYLKLLAQGTEHEEALRAATGNGQEEGPDEPRTDISSILTDIPEPNPQPGARPRRATPPAAPQVVDQPQVPSAVPPQLVLAPRQRPGIGALFQRAINYLGLAPYHPAPIASANITLPAVQDLTPEQVHSILRGSVVFANTENADDSEQNLCREIERVRQEETPYSPGQYASINEALNNFVQAVRSSNLTPEEIARRIRPHLASARALDLDEHIRDYRGLNLLHSRALLAQIDNAERMGLAEFLRHQSGNIGYVPTMNDGNVRRNIRNELHSGTRNHPDPTYYARIRAMEFYDHIRNIRRRRPRDLQALCQNIEELHSTAAIRAAFPRPLQPEEQIAGVDQLPQPVYSFLNNHGIRDRGTALRMVNMVGTQANALTQLVRLYHPEVPENLTTQAQIEQWHLQNRLSPNDPGYNSYRGLGDLVRFNKYIIEHLGDGLYKNVRDWLSRPPQE